MHTTRLFHFYLCYMSTKVSKKLEEDFQITAGLEYYQLDRINTKASNIFGDFRDILVMMVLSNFWWQLGNLSLNQVTLQGEF